jgi:leucyl-tRNA synthetase
MSDRNRQARDLRQNATSSKRLLWSILRGRQLCGLRFRRQHPILPWIADFACVEHRLVVEIDGGYHDVVVANDQKRQQDLEQRGWTVLRFTDKEVIEDAEVVVRAIALQLGLEYTFSPRKNTGSGMKNIRAKRPKPK